jgi:hypothetical protein
MSSYQWMQGLSPWGEVWRQYTVEEQRQAAAALVDALRRGEVPEDLAERLWRRLARALAFRPQGLRRLPPRRLAERLRQHAETVLDYSTWSQLFIAYYARHHAPMMVRFLDGVGIPHDGSGIIAGDIQPSPPEEVAAVAQVLEREFGPHTVARYFDVLLHQAPGWAGLRESCEALRGRAGEAAVEAASEVAPEAVTTAASQDVLSDDFTTLDRVLLDQVIGTASGLEGSLTRDALEDLIDTVLSLNREWVRAYFHLGFMDALLPEREVCSERPELSDRRRGWYLAGVLSAYARQRDRERAVQVLADYAGDFVRSAREPGGAGATMARNLFDTLVDWGRLSEAARLLDGQLAELGLRLAEPALARASELVRDNDIASASTLLGPLRNMPEPVDADPGAFARFRRRVRRRFGQCLQAQGDFPGAREAFEQLLAEDDAEASTELLADLGLTAAGLRGLSDVRLPRGEDERSGLLTALSRGEPWFRQAAEARGLGAVNANVALAVLYYLRHTRPNEQADALRDEALVYAQQAISGMHRADAAAAYERLGIRGQCLFMQAVLQMEKLDPADARAARVAWEAITPRAGAFPEVDLGRLLEAAEVVDPDGAVRIAEAVWRYRKRDALEVLAGGPWLRDSAFLRGRVHDQARDEHHPRALRWRLWRWLVPAFLVNGEKAEAGQALDQLEALTEDQARAAELEDWLADPAHYDSAWSEEDVLWARVRLARRAGRDARAAALLAQLFYYLRDERPADAEQVLDILRAWRLDPAVRESLEAALPEEGEEASDSRVEERLRGGERVDVLFIGGNEVQARYDETVTEALRREWPGARVVFEHTGWGSNWGREVDRLSAAANRADGVVMMVMMRTLLGREIRARLERPWVSCTGTGRQAILHSLRRAAVVGLEQRDRRG